MRDYASSIQQTSDGGYIVAGYTESFGTGTTDFWVLKLDASGIIEWQKIYGDAIDDRAHSVQQTSDGGYVVAGQANSFTWGCCTGGFWVLKLDANGDLGTPGTWQKIYDGADTEVAYSIQQTSDGGFIVAGYTMSFGAGGYDFWVLKLDASGDVTWQKTYGGASNDAARPIQQTADGGYVVAGWTKSFGAGAEDVWVLKLDANGDLGPPGTWQKTYGGTSNDHANSIQQTADGGYVVAGATYSFGAGSNDLWVLKLDANGDLGTPGTWQKTYGGASTDAAISIRQTSDGGFIVAGGTGSFGAGGYDFWVLKLDASGNATWQKTYGGADDETALSVRQTADGSYVAAGYKESPMGVFLEDSWVLKLDANGDIDPACTFISETAVTGVDSAATVTGTAAVAADTTVTPADTTASVADTAADVCDPCATPTAAPTVTPNTAACGTAQTFALNATGGTPPYVAEWDFDGDSNVESVTVGDSTSYVYPAPGDYSPQVRVSTGCLAGAAWIPLGSVTVECPELSYSGHTFTDCGNADGFIDPGETIALDATAQNTGTAGAFSVSGVLSTSTPGVTVFVNNASFPDVSMGASGTSLTPFQFIVDSGVPCGTIIDLTLDLTYQDGWGNPYSSAAASFQVQVGQYLAPLLSEDFEACTVPPAGWTEIENGDPTVPGWEPDGPSCPLGCWVRYILPTNYAVNNSADWCQSWQLTTDTELITPPIDASASANVTLTFDHHFRGVEGGGGGGAETAAVKARSANTGGAWATLVQWDETQTHKGTIVLDATAECAGAVDCQFEWRYGIAQYDLFWAVDNVVVQELVCSPAACGGCSVVSDILPDAPVVCAGACAALDANPSGGTPPYSYSWSTGETARVITVDPAVTTAYSVTVTDSKGCTALSSETVTVEGCPTWARTYGHPRYDIAYAVQQMSDGGYVVAGSMFSFAAYTFDTWILKLDALGNVQWQKIYYPGLHYPTSERYSIQQTTDGGCVIAWGQSSLFILKLDASGEAQWYKDYPSLSLFGGDSDRAIQQTTDGGYIVAGGVNAGAHYLVAKLDAWGEIQWYKTYSNLWLGGGDIHAIQQTTDGGFVVAGDFCDGSTCGLLVLKLDASGNIVWEKVYTDGSTAYSVQQTTDGGFIVAGGDSWILKLDAWGGIEWEKTYGGGVISSIQQTSDGGYIVPGLKLDASGNIEWQKSYGGGVSSIRQTMDGGYIAAGSTTSFGAGMQDFWVLKLDANGNIDPSCTFISDTSAKATDTSTPIASSGLAEDLFFALTVTNKSAVGIVAPSVVTEPCAGSSGCPPLSCSASVDAAAVCIGAAQTFSGSIPGCSVAPLAFEWDFDYDGVTFTAMDSGVTVVYTYLLAGSYTAAFQVTDSCADPGPQTCLSTIPITVAVPDVAYDATFDPVATLAEVCGDGDLIAEPGEEWRATVQLVNNAGCTVNNTVASLTVNLGSAVGAAVCNNPGLYGSIPPLGTAQFIYSFVVDSLAVCVNDVTFDVTGIVSDEGAYPDEVAAFGVTVGQVTVTAVQATDPLMVKNGTVISDFAPALPLATPVSSAELSYTLTHEGGAADLLDCTKVELLDPLAGLTLIKDLGIADPLKPVDVTAAYIGVGTYQLQLTEDGKGCGSGSATISSGTLSVTSATECDVSACACPTCAADILPDAPAICAGASVTLDANPSGGVPPYTYLWSTGAKTRTITVSPAVTTTYDVTVADNASCSVPDSETVTVNPVPATTILESGCIGLNVELDANPSGGTLPYSYLWSTGATTQTIVVVGDGFSLYSVTVTDANGCQGTDSHTTTDCGGPVCAEPSATDISPAVPPLTVDTAGVAAAEELACATGYVVYENAIGAWYGTPGWVCVSPATSNGDGTVTLTGYEVPADSWFVVASANGSGESSCGRDSAGVERNAQPGWPLPGPCP